MVRTGLLSTAAVVLLAPLVWGQAPLPTCEAPLEQPSAPGGRFWVKGDYLYWWVSGASLPPLLTASPPGTPAGSIGVFGAPGTTVLFGGDHVNSDGRSGGRFRVGGWLNDNCTFGVEAEVFMLEGQGQGIGVGPHGAIGRPFTTALTDQPDSQLGTAPGTATIAAGSTGLLGANALLFERFCCGCWHVDLQGGYRYLQFDDNVNVFESLAPAGGAFAPGTRVNVAD